MQTGLDEVDRYLRKKSTASSPENNDYVAVVTGRRKQSDAVWDSFPIRMAGHLILRKQSIHILGYYIDDDGKAKKWVNIITKAHKRILQILLRVS